MTQHLSREMELLKKKILSLSTLVEETVSKAVQSVLERNKTLAQEVMEKDQKIDDLEIEVEEDCLKILALHQPVSIDLRFIIAVLKINNDLERIGDQAVNISSRAASLAELPHIPDPYDLKTMTSRVKIMLQESLDSLVNMDTDLAKHVCRSDEEVDSIHRESYRITKERLLKDPNLSEQMILFLSVSRNLERIADLAENIAEDVIYMISGDIVRHGRGRLAEISASKGPPKSSLERIK